MVKITDKPTHDPVADMRINDAYMRWALDAAEEVVGKQGLAVVLRESGLEKFIDDFPPENLEPPGSGHTFGDYANLNAGLLNFYGRPGKSMVLRIGRLSAQKALTHQSGLFNVVTLSTAKMLPSATQVKLALSALLGGLKVVNEKFGQELKASLDDAADHYVVTLETDFCSAGKQSDQPIGWLFEAAIEESGRQLFDKFFDVVQVQCRSMGHSASVWHVPKQPS